LSFFEFVRFSSAISLPFLRTAFEMERRGDDVGEGGRRPADEVEPHQPRKRRKSAAPSNRLDRSKSPDTLKIANAGFKVSHKEIYRRYAAHYELLVSRQDHAGNIERSIRELGVFHPDADVVELGAGTGRLTRMVAPWVRSIHAFDSSSHMLDLARERMPPSTTTSCTTTFSIGNNREVHTFGLQPSSADVVLAGTSTTSLLLLLQAAMVMVTVMAAVQGGRCRT
jgi:2-polyprenyl-3-methyl-5-hydroxy-6-metoxy-1,4-benzoquinol methylase